MDRIESFLSSLLSKRQWRVLFWIIVIFYVTFMSFLCFHTKIYFRSIDVLYYLSIADNLIENGLFMDGTQTPNGPVITPQNGIVGLFVILRSMSFSRHQVLLFMLVLNYILVLTSLFPLIQIAKAVGLTQRHLIFLMVCIFLGNIRIFQWLFMAPVNDMIFHAGQLWLLYLFIRLEHHFSDTLRLSDHRFVFVMVICILISAVIIHFRINSIFLPLAGILAALFTRRFKMGLFFIGLFIVMMISLLSIFLFFDTFDFTRNTSGIELLFSDTLSQFYIFFFKLLPESLFKDLGGHGNLLYIPFYLAMVVALVHGIRQSNLHLLMILFITLMTFALVLLHGCLTERYLWVIVPFIYMMLLRVRELRMIGILFIFVVLVNTFWMLPYSMEVSRDVLTWQDIAKMDIKQDESLVIAYDNRSCWYFTGLRPIYQNKYTWDDLANAESIYLIGREQYIEGDINDIKRLASENMYEAQITRIPCGPSGKPRFLFYKIVLRPQEDSPNGESDDESLVRPSITPVPETDQALK